MTGFVKTDRFVNIGAGLASARNKNFQLSNVASIIAQQWQNITDFYDDAELDEYVIMPNHIQCYNRHQPEKTGGRKARPYNI